MEDEDTQRLLLHALAASEQLPLVQVDSKAEVSALGLAAGVASVADSGAIAEALVVIVEALAVTVEALAVTVEALVTEAALVVEAALAIKAAAALEVVKMDSTLQQVRRAAQAAEVVLVVVMAEDKPTALEMRGATALAATEMATGDQVVADMVMLQEV